MRPKYDLLRCDSTLEDTEKYLYTVIKNKYDEKDIDMILEALDIAQRAHGTQLRDNNVPYIIHPMRVALLLVNFDERTTAKVFIAALLHDTLEDTDLTSLEVEQKFGEDIAKLVQSLTRQRKTESVEEKQLAKFQKWQKIMNDIYEVRAIKTFDALDNMICWKAIPEGNPARKKITRWLKEAVAMSLPLARITNMQAYNLMQEQYTYYIKEGFGNQQITV